jgi:putative acetyltransferase
MTDIRPERPGDADEIRALHAAAFGQPDEASLVDALRPLANPYIGLVAERGGRVAGHIVFTPVTIGDSGIAALGLGPMAVLPGLQRAGLGSACAAAQRFVVVVLGHPEYYPRFGFEPAASRGLHYRSPELDPAFFVTELRRAALGGARGFVRYLPPFEAL